MNRDYFRRPIQSDRLSHGYGNTRLAANDNKRIRFDWPLFLLLAACLPVAALLACVL